MLLTAELELEAIIVVGALLVLVVLLLLEDGPMTSTFGLAASSSAPAATPTPTPVLGLLVASVTARIPLVGKNTRLFLPTPAADVVSVSVVGFPLPLAALTVVAPPTVAALTCVGVSNCIFCIVMRCCVGCGELGVPAAAPATPLPLAVGEMPVAPLAPATFVVLSLCIMLPAVSLAGRKTLPLGEQILMLRTCLMALPLVNLMVFPSSCVEVDAVEALDAAPVTVVVVATTDALRRPSGVTGVTELLNGVINVLFKLLAGMFLMIFTAEALLKGVPVVL